MADASAGLNQEQQNIYTALINISAAIAQMTLKPKPNYSIDGVSYSWQSLFDSLITKQKELRVQLQEAGGPFEVIVQGNPR